MISDPITLDHEHTRAEQRVMLALLYFGPAAMMTVWALESYSGAITPWDRWLLPISAAAILGSALLMRRRPQWAKGLRVLPVAIFNLYLVVTLLSAVRFASGPQQWYQTVTGMYWVPLAFGCAFVFLPLRQALWVSGTTAAGIFGPLLVWSARDALPPWFDDSGPLLPVLGLAQATFIVLLAAVVTLRNNHEQAHAHMQAMHALARTDMLTSLPNRRAMVEELSRALVTTRRDGRPLAVALIDVDHFKRVNDVHGHATGDAVLKATGTQMAHQLRASDRLGRWGGEEFLLCVPDTEVASAAALAERIRHAVQTFPHAHGAPVTISIGLAKVLPGDDIDALVRRADRALYLAKSRGRNRVEVLAA